MTRISWSWTNTSRVWKCPSPECWPKISKTVYWCKRPFLEYTGNGV